MTAIRFDPKKDLYPRQLEALSYLTDYRPGAPSFVLYGGALGGGKSFLGAYLCLLLLATIPGCRLLIARKHHSDLVQTTLKTFFATAKRFGLDTLLNHNQQKKTVTFMAGTANASELVYLGLDEGTDSELIGIGGLDLSFAFLDESGELSQKVFQTVVQRLRQLPNGMSGKVFLTCNPTAGWLKNDVWSPWNEGRLNKAWRFIPALPQDNPSLPPSYVASLTREALGDWAYETRVMGRWDFLEGQEVLFHEHAVIDAFTWTVDSTVQRQERWVTADVAGAGARADSTIICCWAGLILEEVHELRGRTTVDIASEVKQLASLTKTPVRNIVVDSVGIGQGVVDQVRGCTPFKANARTVRDGFAMLKDDCYYRLSEAFDKHELRIKPQHIRDRLLRELGATKRANYASDANQRVTPKDHVIQAIGHSPDLADAISMRMIGLLEDRRTTFRAIEVDTAALRRKQLLGR